MSEFCLSQSLRDLRGALPMTATGTVVMSPKSACDFIAALDILTDQARQLEAELDAMRWRLGAARDGLRNTASVARSTAIEVDADDAVIRVASRCASIERRAAQIEAVRDGLAVGKVAIFPVIARPRPVDPHATDVEAAMGAIADCLEGERAFERPTHDPEDDCA